MPTSTTQPDTHSEARGRRALVILIAVTGVILLALLGLAVLWSRAAATSDVRRVEPPAARFAAVSVPPYHAPGDILP